MAWAPPRNRSGWPDWEEARKMEESEWRLEPEGKRKCQKSLSCWMRWKALSWTWMVKAAVSR